DDGRGRLSTNRYRQYAGSGPRPAAGRHAYRDGDGYTRWLPGNAADDDYERPRSGPDHRRRLDEADHQYHQAGIGVRNGRARNDRVLSARDGPDCQPVTRYSGANRRAFGSPPSLARR